MTLHDGVLQLSVGHYTIARTPSKAMHLFAGYTWRKSYLIDRDFCVKKYGDYSVVDATHMSPSVFFFATGGKT